jgi:hypothetical protein
MKWYCLIGLLPVLASAANVSVEIRESEVWLVTEGRPQQLTHDGKAKLQAALSPSAARIAYCEECPVTENCTPSVVVLDMAGHRLQSFHVLQRGADEQPCASILRIAWAGEEAIAAECHLNPSLSEYVETEISSGRRRQDLLGYWFTPSPDGTQVAHVGWIVHFAPPYAQSNYLQVGDTTIYPLPKGTGPVTNRAPERPPDVVRMVGQTYHGIHEFLPGFSWSPDAKHIGLIDCTYDWTPNSPAALSAAYGRESENQCALAVVAMDGKAVRFALSELSLKELRSARLSWTSAYGISLEAGGTRRRFTVP